MSAIQTNLSGDTEELLKRLSSLGKIKKRGMLSAIADGLRSTTVDRFTTERDPQGRKWQDSIRASETGGKTLTDTSQLKDSIRSEVTDNGIAVGTNDIRAATLQYGDTRTIRAKNGRYLAFQVGGKWRNVESVTIHIPARPFLGISEEDEQEIQDIINEAVREDG